MIGGFAFSDPTAVAHELIRQSRKGLYVMKTSGGVLVDMLIGAGCVDRLLFCHVWNSVGPVPAHCFRRALEKAARIRWRSKNSAMGPSPWRCWPAPAICPSCPPRRCREPGILPNGHFFPTSSALSKALSAAAPYASFRPQAGRWDLPRPSRGPVRQRTNVRSDRRDELSIAACKKVIVIAEELVDTAEIAQSPGNDHSAGLHGGCSRHRALGRASDRFLRLLLP